ncbi:MAG TPA: NUDIX hydrolase [Jiangellaceae bacterium]|nr:NUDIX hydrolase [Jiangellaceae bacterium]
MEWIIAVLVVVVLLGTYLFWTAGRLDRLHWRVEASRAVLDAQLLRRSGAALDLAGGGLLDPASAVLVADAASRARTVEEPGREQAESELTEALGAALSDPEYTRSLRSRPDADAALDELSAACRRAGHARRFHNDTVRAARRLRHKALVRWLGLAGHAPWPETVELDDELPHGLTS